MIRPRVSSLLVIVALSAVVPRTAASQAADKQRICSQVENHAFTVGTWATYNWSGGPTSGSTMRLAVVGKEPHEGTTYYWYEITIDDPKRPNGKMILQMLVPGLKAGVRTVVMKSANQPAMKLPPQMIQMINATPGTNMAAEIARQCNEMDVVAWEEVTVPGGHFRALHLKHPHSGQEFWVQPDLEFAMVRATMEDGGVMELTGQGTGAKSSITETPTEMPGLPVAPPPR